MMLELFLTSTALILGIFGLRKLTMGKISMRIRYALWFLVAVRLLVPASLGTSAFSIMNLLPVDVRENAQTFSAGRGIVRQRSADDGWDAATAGETGTPAIGERVPGGEPVGGQIKAETGVMPAAASEETVSNKQTVTAADTVPGQEGAPVKADAGSDSDVFSLSDILGALWLLGFLTVGSYMAVSKWRFLRYLRRNRKAFPAEAVPGEFAGLLSRRGMKVYQVKGLPSPCLAGRHIYMGEGTDAAEQNVTHILAHEYCHALHGDGLWAFLRCALAAVYWFDPFVWAAAYAARRDSELACDEAAVKLLGESSRFAYGRTLLALLERAGVGEKCPGMTFMTEGGERSTRERIVALTEKSRMKGPVLAVVLAAVVLVCGCAFTGAPQEEANPVEETGGQETAGPDDAAGNAASQNRQMVPGENSGEFARIQKEYEDVVKTAELTEEQVKELEESALREADRAAFEDALRYYAETDDAELLQKREFDVQSYYSWKEGKDGEKPEDGWYLLCREDGGLIYLYGLYTEDFGFRGMKVRIGGDVTNLDMPWCASYLNGSSENIRILESAENGSPRRFVWKLPARESDTVESWRLYSGYHHDSGTIDLKILTEEECVAWAKKYLSFDVDQEAAKVHVTCDGDMYLGAIDISAYQDWETKDVQIVPGVAGFVLDDQDEGMAVCLSAGLKLKGVEGLWFDGLPFLTIQVAEDETGVSGFRLQNPRIDESQVARIYWQERELSDLREGVTSAQSDSLTGAGRHGLYDGN